jgi:hypothetical protein
MPNSKIHVVFSGKGGGGAKHMGIDPIHQVYWNGIGHFREKRNSKFDKIMILLQIDDDADVLFPTQKWTPHGRFFLRGCKMKTQPIIG